ncbi:MAG: GNAT family N-acetyltransferase [Saprospiraceae bacterium]
MEILSTQRLTISEAQLSDRQFFYDLMNSSGWLQYIGDRGIHTLGDAENYIQNSLLASYQANDFGLYKLSLKSNTVSIGICGFLKREYLEQVDIGFAMLPDYTGRGLMKEAAMALIQKAQSDQVWTKILAITSPENERSKGLLRTLGFQEKGLIQPNQEPILLFERKL